MCYDKYRQKITIEAINTLPMFKFAGEVCLIRTEEELHKALPVLRAETILGFDTETRPTFRKGKMNTPALIQLATAETVYLVQLVCVPLGGELAALLGDAGIVKAGVSIMDDIRALQKMHPFTSAGLVDLGHVAHTHRLETRGLRNLAANFFGFRISKGSQCSNWSQRTLSARQMTYAATDAWIGRMVYLYMAEIGMIERFSIQKNGSRR